MTPRADGHCSFPGCQAFVDFHVHDKPPAGWGHGTLARYGQKKFRHVTYLLCPAHTLILSAKQPSLPGVQRSARKRVYIATPYAGNVERNLRYLRMAMRDCLNRGEAPFAPHGLYTQPGVLRDEIISEREIGIEAGHEWLEAADFCAYYTDLGRSHGVEMDLRRAHRLGKKIVSRKVKGWRYDSEDQHKRTTDGDPPPVGELPRRHPYDGLG